jgi:hypothetical protein
MLMQSKMKDIKVSAVSDSIAAGKGVYALGSKDKTGKKGVSVMVWNYQHTNTASFQTRIDMANLPGNLRNAPVRQQVYRIDEATSNYYTNPETANLQLVDDRVVQVDKDYTQTVTLSPNALYLIVLDPA